LILNILDKCSFFRKHTYRYYKCIRLLWIIILDCRVF
jgi:hypothetical protein